MKGKHLKFTTQDSEGREVKQNKKNPTTPKKGPWSWHCSPVYSKTRTKFKGQERKSLAFSAGL